MEPVDSEGNPPPIWKYRRLAVFIILSFCIGTITYLVLHGEDTRLNETIANGVLFLMGAVSGSYIFGATWDSKGR